MIRINGIPIDELKVEGNNSILEILRLCNQKNIDVEDLTKRLLYAKSANWKLEDEARILFDLNSTDQAKGDISKPDLDNDILNMVPNMFSKKSEIYLKKIPFSAFKSLIFGYGTDEEIQSEVISKAKKNSELNHLVFKKVKHNIYGKLETSQISI